MRQKEEEEKRKTIEKHAEQAKKQAEYNDQLSRSRYKDQLKEQESSQEKIRKDNV